MVGPCMHLVQSGCGSFASITPGAEEYVVFDGGVLADVAIAMDADAIAEHAVRNQWWCRSKWRNLFL